MEFITKQVSSLQRVFLDGKCDLTEINSGSALRGERFSYQIAYRSDEKFFADIVVDSPIAQYITVRAVGNVPSEMPVYNSDCDCYERTEAGLFPDVLFPIDSTFAVKRYNYYSLWITAELPKDIEPGDYGITIKILRDNEEASSNTFELKVLDAVLL